MQQLAQVLKFSTINESFRKKNDPKSKTLVLFQFLVGAAARAAQCLTSCLPTYFPASQRPGGLQARVESYALRRHRRSTVASRRRVRGARSAPPASSQYRGQPPPPSRPWRARRPPTAEAAEISTFWLIKLGKTSSAEG